MIRVVLVRFVGDVSPDSTHSGINQLWELFCFDRSEGLSRAVFLSIVGFYFLLFF